MFVTNSRSQESNVIDDINVAVLKVLSIVNATKGFS